MFKEKNKENTKAIQLTYVVKTKSWWSPFGQDIFVVQLVKN